MAVNPFYSVKKGELAAVAAKNRKFNKTRSGCSSRLNGKDKKTRNANLKVSKKWM